MGSVTFKGGAKLLQKTLLCAVPDHIVYAQVVGAFLEGGSNDENNALKKAVQTQPSAPEDLGSQGIGFASKL